MPQMMPNTTAQRGKKLPKFCAKVTGQEHFLGDFLSDQDFAPKTGQMTGQRILCPAAIAVDKPDGQTPPL